MNIPAEDRPFVEEARERPLAHASSRRRAGRTDVIYAAVRSASGTIYDGIPLETAMPQFDCCAERHAINNMRQEEPKRPRLDTLLVATPVPDDATDPPTPCGACRHVIDECSQDATVYRRSRASAWGSFGNLRFP